MLISNFISYSVYQNIIFALLLISGSVKFIFSDIDFQLDITLIFSILIFTDILLNLLKTNLNIKASTNQSFFILAYFSFYFLMIFSLIYTKSPSYGYGKTFFFILNLISFVYVHH